MRSVRTASTLLVLFSLACGPSGGTYDSLRTGVEDHFIGGWDGENTYGPTVLLLREGLMGTLNAVRIDGVHNQYELSYAVEGTLTDDGAGLELALSCAEGRSRPTGTDGVGSKMDCSGWELELICSLAGHCTNGDCNMVCDVVYFGDGYGRSGVSLRDVEEQFDFWRRA